MALLTPDFLQTKTYSAKRTRQAILNLGGLQEGVLGSNDYKVIQRAAGANMSVDVGSGFALVTADDAGNRGLYHEENDATVNVAVTASSGSNPRIDQIILQINDSTDGGDATDVAALSVLTGTATVGATLDNRTGAAALPTGCLRLADILVPTSSTSVVTANIRDRRQWARGAFFSLQQPVTSDILFSSTTPSALHTWTVPRIECSGVPVRITLAENYASSSAGGNMFTVPAIDGASIGSTFQRYIYNQGASAGLALPMFVDWSTTPAAGSHTFDIFSAMVSGNATLGRGTGLSPGQLIIEELLRPAVSNN